MPRWCRPCSTPGPMCPFATTMARPHWKRRRRAVMPISSPCCAASASPASNSISRGQAIIVIRRLQQFFAEQIQQRAATAAAGSERALHLATAALLIEVTRADYQVELSEQKAVVAAVQDLLGLTVQETEDLIVLVVLV